MAIIVQDSFNRADQTGLGNADTGQAWVALTGTFKIISNQASVTADSGNQFAYIDSTEANGKVSAYLSQSTSGTYAVRLAFRIVDANNLWFIDFNGSTWRLMKRVSGTYTQVATSTNNPNPYTSPVKMLVEFNGNEIKWYINDTLDKTVTDSALATATKHGIGAEKTYARIDDFLVESLTSAGAIIDAGAIAITAESTLTSSASRILTSNATFQADTTFTSSAQRILNGMSSISADTGLSAIASRILSSNVNLAGDSALTADATVLTVGITIDLSASSTLSADGSKTIQGASVLTANGAILATGSFLLSGEVALMSDGELSVFMGEYYRQIIGYTLTITPEIHVETTIIKRKDFDLNI